MSEEVPDEIVHVADNVDEFVERTRLKQIHDAKAAAAEALRESRFQAEGGGSLEEAREYARGAVEGYILEVEALYHRTDVGRELWESSPLGVVPIEEAVIGTDGEVVTVQSIGEELTCRDEQIAVLGVETFVEGLQGTVDLRVEVENGGWDRTVKETKDFTGRVSTPIWLSREAYRATNALLSETDVGVKLGEDEGSAEWDTSYRDDE